tara:strand:- start:2481 stop:2627 length:147 start_codon:yes stop_codon:yes gene_type:complete
MSDKTILDTLLQDKLDKLPVPVSKKKDKDYSILTKDEKTLLYKNGIKH